MSDRYWNVVVEMTENQGMYYQGQMIEELIDMVDDKGQSVDRDGAIGKLLRRHEITRDKVTVLRVKEDI